LESKQAMLEGLSKAEGVVFKRIFSPYTPGRPSTGGDQLKHKFHATVSAVVSGINEKRSVEISLLQEQQGWITAGKVAIPVNQPVPPIGAVVEIRSLYAFKESGCLFQPVFLGLRSDLDQEECTVDQLKYKSEERDPSQGTQPNHKQVVLQTYP
jgi:bifunctional non-homologous end joining protein LigD